jgi:hypothetical protein
MLHPCELCQSIDVCILKPFGGGVGRCDSQSLGTCYGTDYSEIGKNERDDARIAELNEKVNSLYGQIMGDEGMTAYNEAKRECENLVNYIDAIINTAMNGGDPMTVQEPSASCTGSCSTCGGCH